MISKPAMYKDMQPISLAYYEARLVHDRMTLTWDLHVLCLKHVDGYIYTHCLDMDILAYGRSEAAAETNLLQMIFHQITDYVSENRLEFLMESSVEASVLTYYHDLKRSYYRDQGRKMDRLLKDSEQFEVSEQLIHKNSIETRTIIVEKKEQWYLLAA